MWCSCTVMELIIVFVANHILASHDQLLLVWTTCWQAEACRQCKKEGWLHEAICQAIELMWTGIAVLGKRLFWQRENGSIVDR